MTLDEAIKHAEEVADFCEDAASKYDMTDDFESYMACKDGKCAEEHRQLAEWLKDYKRLLEQGSLLDKIRDEIVYLGERTMNDNRAGGIWACRDIIDRCKKESEGSK